MEKCKHCACAEGFIFDDETLEYNVSKRNLHELFPKMMIQTLYDYLVHNVEVLKGYGKYKLYPTNQMKQLSISVQHFHFTITIIPIG